jgi:hypothetical protein
MTGLFPPPTLGERRHRGLARWLIAARRRAVFVIVENQRSHPRRAHGRRRGVEDAADDSVIGEHVEIVIVPFAGWARS